MPCMAAMENHQNGMRARNEGRAKRQRFEDLRRGRQKLTTMNIKITAPKVTKKKKKKPKNEP